LLFTAVAFVVFLLFFTKKKLLYFLSLAVCLIVREHVGFLISAIGVFLFLISKDKITSLLTIVTGFAWSVIVIWGIMPFFGEFSYTGFRMEGERLELTIINYLAQPIQTLKLLFSPIIKLKTVFLSFAGFAFFPLLCWPIFVPLFYQFASRFLDKIHSYRWTPYYHFSGELASLLAVATVFAFKKFSLLFPPSEKAIKTASLILLLAVVLEQIFLPVPLKNIIKKDFYLKKAQSQVLKEVFNLIPGRASIATQNNLAPHFSQREKIYILPQGIGAEYVLVDLSKGQDGWNFYTLQQGELKELVYKLVKETGYAIIEQKANVLLLKKV
jgi:uncharacterized membrane protein